MFPNKSYLIIGLSLFVMACPEAELDSSDSSGDSCACLNKDNIYQVFDPAPDLGNFSSTAACDDNNDVLLSGGCTWDEEHGARVSLPRHNSGTLKPAEWYCEGDGGQTEAEAFCLRVD